MPRRTILAAVWTGVILLALIGVLASVGRGIALRQVMQSPVKPGSGFSRFDSLNVVNSAPLYGAKPGSPKYREIEAETRRFVGKFGKHPGATLLHILPAVVFMALAPFQFSRRMRARNIRLHRWSGRLLVTIAIPIGLTGLFFGLFMPFSGAVEASGVAVFGALFLFALARAVVAIRRREIARHREWMIRMFAIAIGVSTVRLTGIAFALATREGPHAWFGYSVWVGFAVTALAAELWIRSTRPAPLTHQVPYSVHP